MTKYLKRGWGEGLMGSEKVRGGVHGCQESQGEGIMDYQDARGGRVLGFHKGNRGEAYTSLW